MALGPPPDAGYVHRASDPSGTNPVFLYDGIVVRKFVNQYLTTGSFNLNHLQGPRTSVMKDYTPRFNYSLLFDEPKSEVVVRQDTKLLTRFARNIKRRDSVQPISHESWREAA